MEYQWHFSFPAVNNGNGPMDGLSIMDVLNGPFHTPSLAEESKLLTLLGKNLSTYKTYQLW